MANAIKKVLRKIRHKFKPPEKVEPLWKKLQVQAAAREYQGEFWERDKKIVRNANFQKALIARERQVEAIRAEKARQEQIIEIRLKNLKKARRKLKRMREQDDFDE